MASRGRPLFDLNEPPAGYDEDNGSFICSQPQKALPAVNSHTSGNLTAVVVPLGIENNNAFLHESSLSGFQPFTRPRSAQNHASNGHLPSTVMEIDLKTASSSKSDDGEEVRGRSLSENVYTSAKPVDREEGEWSDGEGDTDNHGSGSYREQGGAKANSEITGNHASMLSSKATCSGGVSENCRSENSNRGIAGLDLDANGSEPNVVQNNEGNDRIDVSGKVLEEPPLISKQREVKGIEASYALKCANNPVKRKMDEQKEAMLGKKRNRQTMFLNLEDVKQAGQMKTSTPRRQPAAPGSFRTPKEVRTILPPSERLAEKQGQPIYKDARRMESSPNEGGAAIEYKDSMSDCNGDVDTGISANSKRLTNVSDLVSEGSQASIARQGSWKQSMDPKLGKNSHMSNKKPSLVNQTPFEMKVGNKKHLTSKKAPLSISTYQDTSVERLIRELTNENFWQQPGFRIC